MLLIVGSFCLVDCGQFVIDRGMVVIDCCMFLIDCGQFVIDCDKFVIECDKHIAVNVSVNVISFLLKKEEKRIHSM